MELNFTKSLINYCSNNISPITLGHRSNFEVNLWKTISYKANEAKEYAQTILRNHTMIGCETLHITNLPDTPTLKELEEMDKEKALNKIYSTLQLHSASLHFTYYQFNNSTIRCSEAILGERSLATKLQNLAIKIKSLACIVRVGIMSLGYNLYDFSSSLNVTMTNSTICSRRALRDCQVTKSTYNSLNIVEDYTHTPERKTTTLGRLFF